MLKKRGLRPRHAVGLGRGFLIGRRGSAAVEYAMVLPLILLFFFSITDISLWVVDDAELLNGVQVAVREVRVGLLTSASQQSAFIQAICDHSGRTGADCSAVQVNLQQFAGLDSVTWPTSASSYTYQSTSGQSVVAVTVTAPHTFVVPWDGALYGGSGTQTTLTQYALVVTEPYQ